MNEIAPKFKGYVIMAFSLATAYLQMWGISAFMTKNGGINGVGALLTLGLFILFNVTGTIKATLYTHSKATALVFGVLSIIFSLIIKLETSAVVMIAILTFISIWIGWIFAAKKDPSVFTGKIQSKKSYNVIEEITPHCIKCGKPLKPFEIKCKNCGNIRK